MEVYSLEGGIKAWDGLIATGTPEAGMSYFAPATSPQEVVALAWILEEGSRKFYSGIRSLITSDSMRSTFKQLEDAEEHHKNTLAREYARITRVEPTRDFAERELRDETIEDVMEGGMRISDALTWVKNRPLSDVLELVLSLETNAYDLYVKMERFVDNIQSKGVFHALADEERNHLRRVSSLLDRLLEKGSD